MSLWLRALKELLGGSGTPDATIDDPVFGKMLWQDGVWGYVPTSEVCTGREFVITVDAGQDGPSIRQRQLFQRILDNMASVMKAAREYVVAAGEVQERNLDLYSVEIHDEARTSTNEFVIELSDPLAHVISRIHFSGDVPYKYDCDC